ncbi:MAG TPA: hypothetical protein VLJ42_10230 [Solirubrobacteraceae bacterium]|nr:hypothetical protein [Solirubrobacteraceae bacterium]
MTITPFRPKLHRPQPLVVAVPQVALEDVLAGLRSQAGLPVGDLAAMLGVSRRQFYNWVSCENEPDLEQEQRVRRTATLVTRLHEHYPASRLVRAALLTSTVNGSAFDAFKENDLVSAELAVDAVIAVAQKPREGIAPVDRLPYDRERVLIELEHLRGTPRQGDG